MSNISLYQIEKEYLQIVDTLIQSEGELSPELEEALQINKEQLQQKGIGYGYIIKQLEYDVDMVDAELKRLQAIKKSRTNAMDRLKASLSGAMQLHEVTELKTPTLKINFRKSESVEVLDVALLDVKFVKEVTTKSADKTAIKEAIKSGESVTGAILQSNLNLQVK